MGTLSKALAASLAMALGTHRASAEATSNFSLNLEYRFQHVSNAGLAGRNLGINAHGPVMGVSWFS